MFLQFKTRLVGEKCVCCVLSTLSDDKDCVSLLKRIILVYCKFMV